MAQQARLIKTVKLGDDAATTAAGGTGQGAFDGEDEFALRIDLGLKHADIGDIERDRDERVLVHVRPSFHITCES